MQPKNAGQPISDPYNEIRELLTVQIELLERLRDASPMDILRKAKINESFMGPGEYKKALNFIKNRDVDKFDINGLINILKSMDPKALISSPKTMQNLTALLKELPIF